MPADMSDHCPQDAVSEDVLMNPVVSLLVSSSELVSSHYCGVASVPSCSLPSSETHLIPSTLILDKNE